MGIESLKSIYDPILTNKEEKAISANKNYGMISERDAVEQQISTINVLHSWKDSAPVVRLSEYLKKNNNHGIRLNISDGHPLLRFDPGLSKIKTEKDRIRWQIATNCLELLKDALPDLKYLIAHDLIKLPELMN